MPLIINQEAERLARELAETTGESIDQAVLTAIRERLERQRTHSKVSRRLVRLAKEIAHYPVFDDKGPDEILSHDDRGIPF